MNQFTLISDFNMSRIEQVATSIKQEIERGRLRKNDQLPSINDFSRNNIVARDTVEKAYRKLKLQGLITSVPGKGYFVLGKKKEKINVLLILNKLSTFKKEVYYSFVEALGNSARVDLQVHHYSIDLCRDIIEANLGKYHYYVIMPHFNDKVKRKAVAEVLGLIPNQELIILDRYIKAFNTHCTQIYQDLENDIHEALYSAGSSLDKYRKIVIILKKSADYPFEILKGIQKFCDRTHKKFEVLSTLDGVELCNGFIYIETSDPDLAELIKMANSARLKIGKDIGIISFNETVLKEILGISVMTTDFKVMGKTAALSIQQNKVIQLKNPFRLIKRKSL